MVFENNSLISKSVLKVIGCVACNEFLPKEVKQGTLHRGKRKKKTISLFRRNAYCHFRIRLSFFSLPPPSRRGKAENELEKIKRNAWLANCETLFIRGKCFSVVFFSSPLHRVRRRLRRKEISRHCSICFLSFLGGSGLLGT